MSCVVFSGLVVIVMSLLFVFLLLFLLFRWLVGC